jgi:DNA-binding protein HU-beta
VAVKKAAKKAAPKASGGPMTQTQIINYLAEKSEVNKKVVKGILDALGELAVAQTKKNDKFVYPGLGRLVKSQRKKRTGRNPATGATIQIAAKKVAAFKAAKGLRDRVSV